MFNPLTRNFQKNWHFYTKNEKREFFFKIKVYTTCDKECVMATRVPNPISFYYTLN